MVIKILNRLCRLAKSLKTPGDLSLPIVNAEITKEVSVKKFLDQDFSGAALAKFKRGDACHSRDSQLATLLRGARHSPGQVASSVQASWDDIKKYAPHSQDGQLATLLRDLGARQYPVIGQFTPSTEASWDDIKKELHDMDLISDSDAAPGRIVHHDCYGHGALSQLFAAGQHKGPSHPNLPGHGALSRLFAAGQHKGPSHPNLPVGKMMFEFRVTNTLSGFVIHNLTPVFFDGTKLHRVCTHDRDFIEKWLPFVESHVNSLPKELLSDMHQYWYCLDKNQKDEVFWAKRFLRHGILDGKPIMDDYWKQTMDAGMPFFRPDSMLSLEKILKNYPRGGIYNCNQFRADISLEVKKDISVRYDVDLVGDTVLNELLFLLDKGKLVDHPEIFPGCHPVTKSYFKDFNFKG